MPERFIAVDWSGAFAPSAQKNSIWIADWHAGKLHCLDSGISREKTIAYIETAAKETSSLVVGLDFAFSYPAWFLEVHRCPTAHAFWQLVADGKGEEWLRESGEVFWGRGKRPVTYDPARAFRATEISLKNETGGKAQPKSGFQINGVGSVGTGSLRGIRYLPQLHEAGFSIWPFDPPGLKTVIEIYPRLFTGTTITSKCSARLAHLDGPQFTGVCKEQRLKAQDSEHAFDALCSVIGMKEHADQLANLQQASDETELLEGRIWHPETTFARKIEGPKRFRLGPCKSSMVP
jgi:hypothetical protein